jgi:hypothetical protein
VLEFIIFVKVHLNMVNYGIYIRIEQRINRECSCLNLRTSKDSSNSTSSSQESDKDASEGSSVAVDNSNSVGSAR